MGVTWTDLNLKCTVYPHRALSEEAIDYADRHTA